MNQKYDQMWFTFLIQYDFWLPQLWQHLVGILMAASFHLLLSLEFAEPSKEGQRFNCQHYPHSLPRPIIIRTLSHFSGPKLAQSLRVGIKRQLDRDSIVGEKKQPHLTTSLEWREEEKEEQILPHYHHCLCGHYCLEFFGNIFEAFVNFEAVQNHSETVDPILMTSTYFCIDANGEKLLSANWYTQRTE